MQKDSEAESIAGAESAKEVAESILAWAKKYNLLSKSGVEDAIEPDDAEPSIVPPQLFSGQTVKAIFRKRAINLVAFNEGERKVIIFVNGKPNKTELKALPFSSQNGIQIDYEVGGIAQVKGGQPFSERLVPYTFHNDRYACGSSIFPVNCCGAGTMGALVRGGDGAVFGLTNNHVTGACNHAVPGLPILAPGPIDATEDSMDPFCIGRHDKLLPINDGIPENINVALNCDAAIFRIADLVRVSSMQGDKYDTPSSVMEPIPGMRVEKFGRTTGFTGGRILGVSASPVPVHYSIAEYGVKKSVYFQSVIIVKGDNDTFFSRPGDSGSLVIGYDSSGARHAVGLVFAGDDKGHSFIISLPKILQDFGLSIVHGHNT